MKLVSLRHDIPGQYADDDAFNVVARAYIAARARARELGRRYTVAPRQALTTQDGRTLQPGDEVVVTDFKHITEQRDRWSGTLDRSPWQQLETLVHGGFVIEADVPEPRAESLPPEPPEAA